MQGDLAGVRESLIGAFKCLEKGEMKGFCPLDDVKVLLMTTGEMKLSEDEVADLLGTCESTATMVNYRDLADAFVLRFEHARSKATTVTGPVLVEQGHRLSQCMLWSLLQLWYSQSGPQAWGIDAIPSYITSNCHIARAYAVIVSGFLRDLLRMSSRRRDAPQLDLTRPLYLIELGGGHGKFTHLFLRQLMKLRKRSPHLKLVKLVYVITDVAASNIDTLLRKRELVYWKDKGLLDFATFNCENDTSIHLRVSGVTLSPKTPSPNPIICVANYLFDSLRADAFRVVRGKLQEGQVRLEDPEPSGCEPGKDPTLIDRVKLKWEYVEVGPEYYNDPVLDRVLREYLEHFQHTEASFTIPIGACVCLRSLSRMCMPGLPVGVLAGDKGDVHWELFEGSHSPHIAIHGCFSMMFNFHAFELFMRHAGGFQLQPQSTNASLKVSVGALNAQRTDCLDLCRAFQTSVLDFGPDEFCTVEHALSSESFRSGRAKRARAAAPLNSSHRPAVAQVHGLLQLSAGDTEAMLQNRWTLIKGLRLLGGTDQSSVLELLESVWGNSFRFMGEGDVAFCVGWLLMSCKSWAQAAVFLLESLRLRGGHAATYTNLGVCYYRGGEVLGAGHWFERALRLDGKHRKAMAWRNALAVQKGLASEAELKGLKAGELQKFFFAHVPI